MRHARLLAIACVGLLCLSASSGHAADKLVVVPVVGKMPKPKLAALDEALLKALGDATAAEIVGWGDAQGRLPPREAKVAGRCKKPVCWAKLAAKLEVQLVVTAQAAMVKKQPRITLTLIDATGATLKQAQEDLAAEPENVAASLQAAVAQLAGALPAAGAGVAASDTAAPPAPLAPTDSASPDSAPVAAPAVPTSGWLGIKYSPVTAAIATRFALAQPEGAWIIAVHPSGPAHTAGILVNDIVTGWGGEPVHSDEELGRLLRATPVGETILVRLWRAGHEVNYTPTLAERQAWPSK